MRKHPVWCLGLFLIAAQLGFGQNAPHEESVVRETYAKLAFAAQTAAVVEAVQNDLKIDSDSLARRVAQQEIHFTIQDVTAGNIRDIANKSYDDYVTKPETGDALNLGLTNTTVQAEGSPEVHQIGTRGEWEAPAKVTRGSLSWVDMTVGKALSQTPDYDRYAAATVVVSYLGRSHAYKTLWLFDSTGKQAVLPIDLLTGNSLLMRFVTEDVTPIVLLDTRALSTHPAVRQWLQTHQTADSSCKGKICCIPSGECGVTASAVSTALQKYAAQTVQATTPHGAAIVTPQLANGDCSTLSFTKPPISFSDTDSIQHETGYHNDYAQFTGTCNYDLPMPRQTLCSASSIVTTYVSVGETGFLLSNLAGYFHVRGWDSGSGAAQGTAPTASTAIGVAIRNCFGGACGVSVSVSGVGVTFPSDAVWKKAYTYSNMCPPHNPPSPGTPIILDTDGRGYYLTSAVNGVKFDLRGDGHPIKISWTRGSSSNGFLALDRNHNGKIDNGTELFGNFTAQPQSPDPNGFLALALFDSNHDGVIDDKDTIWPELRLWIDSNHDGISQRGELFLLTDLGFRSLSLKYTESQKKDQYGNLFRYKARVNVGDPTPDPVGRLAYDVFLVEAK